MRGPERNFGHDVECSTFASSRHDQFTVQAGTVLGAFFFFFARSGCCTFCFAHLQETHSLSYALLFCFALHLKKNNNQITQQGIVLLLFGLPCPLSLNQ